MMKRLHSGTNLPDFRITGFFDRIPVPGLFGQVFSQIPGIGIKNGQMSSILVNHTCTGPVISISLNVIKTAW
jgi:hypothetical protein